MFLPQDSLKIISPNGGEKFYIGSDTVITWTGIPLTDTVKLEYSTDAGTSWNFITDTATGGRYLWHVPKTVSDSCLVRVKQISSSVGKHWVKGAGGMDSVGVGRNFANASAVDNYGNVYITGDFQYTANFDGIKLKGANNRVFFIAKYHSDGSLQWVKQAGDKILGYSSGNSLAIDSVGNIFVTGTSVSYTHLTLPTNREV